MAKVKDTRKELRSMKDVDLSRRLEELREKARDLAFKAQGDEVKNVQELRAVKKDVARILTLMADQRRIKQS